MAKKTTTAKTVTTELVDKIAATIKVGSETYTFEVIRPDPKVEKKIIQRMKEVYGSQHDARKITLENKRLGTKEEILLSKIEDAKGEKRQKLLEELTEVYDRLEIIADKDKENFFKELDIDAEYANQCYNRLNAEDYEKAEEFAKKYGWKELRDALEKLWEKAKGNN